MRNEDYLKILPINYRHEKKFLLKSEFNTIDKLRNLKDSEINIIIKEQSLCTKSRLKKIRAMATLMIDLDISHQYAFVLMHSGVVSIKALSVLDPHSIANKIGRFERGLNLKNNNSISFLTIKKWIERAKELV